MSRTLYDARIELRLTSEEKLMLEQAAGRARQSVAEFVRQAVWPHIRVGEESGPSDTMPSEASGSYQGRAVTAAADLGVNGPPPPPRNMTVAEVAAGGGCPMVVPSGTRCKACGKVH